MNCIMENKLFENYRKVFGKLKQSQVDAINTVISKCGIDVAVAILGQQPEEVKPLSISQKGLDLIKLFEGFSSTAYKDVVGIWTIGYGTIKYPNGKKVQPGDTCTKDQAEQYLIHDTKWVVDALKPYSHLKQNQIDALSSFIYNVGATAFNTSTLKKYIDSGNISLVANEFSRWNKAGGKVVKGLTLRRAKEKSLFEEAQ